MNVLAQEKINASTVSELIKMWGNIPSWEDFKQASKEGRLRISKPIALKYIYTTLVPKSYRILFGIITMSLWVLAIPICVAGWIFLELSAWWILGGFIVAWYLKDVSKNGHCQAIEETAFKSEEFYKLLVNEGAFLFPPPQK